MNLDAMVAQRDALNAQIDEQKALNRAQKIDDIRTDIRIFDLTAKELFPTTKRAAKTVAPKYRHPETGATWTGRGRPPAWVDKQAHLIGG
jgi:DNA-binding protein H-NS